jgi:formate dehydrogenase subunit gamma
VNALSVPEKIPAGEVQRYTFHERLCHWITGIAYTYCLATGLAFYTPYLFWLAIVLGGGPTSRYWHPILGVAFFIAILWMHAIWRNDLAMTAEDRKWLSKTEYYATNRDELVPPAGKFNGGQKLYYWAIFYGAILLLLSGLVMWFPELIPFGARWVRAIAIVLHECAALITIGAFIVHIYMSVFLVPGSLEGMTVGHVPKAWARAHHRLWYDKIAPEK